MSPMQASAPRRYDRGSSAVFALRDLVANAGRKVRLIMPVQVDARPLRGEQHVNAPRVPFVRAATIADSSNGCDIIKSAKLVDTSTS